MSVLYIGAVVVIGLLVGFVALAVLWLTKTVGRGIEVRTVQLISQYDELLEDRSRQLIRMENQLTMKQEKSSHTSPIVDASPAVQGDASAPSGHSATLLNASQRMGVTKYREQELVSLYHQIKAGFSTPPEEILHQLELYDQEVPPGPATTLLEELRFDEVFQLCTLPGEDQYQLLTEVLSPQGQALLEECTQGEGWVDGIAFYNFLRDKADLEPKPPFIRVAPGVVITQVPPKATVVEDWKICEGFQVETGTMLYDYCMKAREIS